MGPRSAAPLSRKGPHWQPLRALQSHIRPSFYPPLLREAFSSEGLHLGRQRLGCERPRRHRWFPFWSPPVPSQKYRYGRGRASGQRPVFRMGEFPMAPAPKVLPRFTLSARPVRPHRGRSGIDLPPKKWTGLSWFELHLDRADIADRRMAPSLVVEALDVGKDIALLRVLHFAGDGRSVLSVWKKLSIGALS